jgi:hypothetical protein
MWQLVNDIDRTACPAAVLSWIAQHTGDSFLNDWLLLANSRGCPAEVLSWMAQHTSESFLSSVITNHQNCPAETLVLLLHNPHPEVRQRAASNPNLPASVLAMWQLAQG